MEIVLRDDGAIRQLILDRDDLSPGNYFFIKPSKTDFNKEVRDVWFISDMIFFEGKLMVNRYQKDFDEFAGKPKSNIAEIETRRYSHFISGTKEQLEALGECILLKAKLGESFKPLLYSEGYPNIKIELKEE